MFLNFEIFIDFQEQNRVNKELQLHCRVHGLLANFWKNLFTEQMYQRILIWLKWFWRFFCWSLYALAKKQTLVQSCNFVTDLCALQMCALGMALE
jgi:hypothetical protein